MFAVFRLMGVVAISVTFVVFHVALSHLLDLDGWERSPTSCSTPSSPSSRWRAGCCSARGGSRRRGSRRWTVLFPIVYMIATAIRGPLVRDWYPYPFADVAAHGYLRVLLNGIVITFFFWLVAAGATWVDQRLPDRDARVGERPSSEPGSGPGQGRDRRRRCWRSPGCTWPGAAARRSRSPTASASTTPWPGAALDAATGRLLRRRRCAHRRRGTGRRRATASSVGCNGSASPASPPCWRRGPRSGSRAAPTSSRRAACPPGSAGSTGGSTRRSASRWPPARQLAASLGPIARQRSTCSGRRRDASTRTSSARCASNSAAVECSIGIASSSSWSRARPRTTL